MAYKRNQIVQAIARLVQTDSAKPSSETRTRLKRLLETDRNLGRSKRSADPERANFAFFTMDAPGRGVEIWFSGYEAFALLTGLRLLQHGWPQTSVVAVLRRVRPDLERHHARILRQDPAMQFDQEAIMRQAQSGNLVVHSTDPVFLVIQRREGSADGLISSTLCRAAELMGIILREAGIASTILELTAAAHILASELAKTRPTKRGRGSE